MNKIKAVIFDMDGVLVDTEASYQERRRSFMESQGYDVSQINWLDFIGETFETLWDRIEPFVDVDCATLQERYVIYKKAHPLHYESVVTPHVIETIKQLHDEGYTLAVASASSLSDIQRALDVMGVRDCFTSLLSGRDLERTKPYPDIYIQTLEKLGLPATEAIAVEDSPVGIQAARSAGLYTVAYHNPFYQLDQSQSQQQITDMRQLPTILARLSS